MLWAIGIMCGVLCLGIWVWRTQQLSLKRETRSPKDVIDSFHHRREWLEAKFMTLASQSGRPRGLRWLDCDFDNEVSLARDRQTKRYRAFVAVTVQFEAEPGGGMEHVEAVSNLRAATAVFHLDDAEWSTDGRVCLNLTPTETIRHFQHELEVV